jgi:GTPase KRas
VGHFVESYEPTIADSYSKKFTIDSKVCGVDVLDTGGALRDERIRDGEGFVLVYSATSRFSFLLIQELHNKIRGVKAAAPVVLVENKTDLTAGREVSTDEGRKLAWELSCDFVEASAKTGMGVKHPFFNVAGKLNKQRQKTHLSNVVPGNSDSSSKHENDKTRKKFWLW